MIDYKHWAIDRDEQDILWLGLNRQDTPVNTLNEAVLNELNSILHEVALDKKAIGLVIYSQKKKGFIAGADIHVISQLEHPEAAVHFLQKGLAVFSRLEGLTIPTLALIDGFCMGGGYELALACTYRIASDQEDTRIGLPEVLLGFHPGWGGTVRLPQLVGGFKALASVMLSGKAQSAHSAKRLGMIDEVVPVRQLNRAAVHFIKNRPPKHKASFLNRLSNQGVFRKAIAFLLRYKVAKRVRKEHYPAPYAMIDLWEREGGFGDRAYLKETDSVEQLISQGDTSKNLIRAFFLRERLKSFAKDSAFKAKHVHVIGAGIMGGDIAAWCALRGIRVTLQDKSYEQIGKAYARAFALAKKKYRKPRLIQAVMDRLIPDPEGRGIALADVIIEAAFEDLKVKQTIFKKVETLAKAEAIIATNTSSIPLHEISQVMKNPERLVGIHFFNPVAKMDLVEVVSSSKTAKKAAADASSFVNQMGKLPLPVQSSPGFLVNRILMPYLLECVHLLEEGYRAEDIDEAALQFGMVMGPVELADTVGMDVCLAVADNLTSHFGGTVPQKLRDMVKKGELGRKTGKGFYTYKRGKPIKNSPSSKIDPSLASRLVFCMLKEAAAALREKVVEDSDLLDAGMIFAAGFAPFRGGPMQYAHDFGRDNLDTLFKSFELKYGKRFRLDESLS